MDHHVSIDFVSHSREKQRRLEYFKKTGIVLPQEEPKILSHRRGVNPTTNYVPNKQKHLAAGQGNRVMGNVIDPYKHKFDVFDEKKCDKSAEHLFGNLAQRRHFTGLGDLDLQHDHFTQDEALKFKLKDESALSTKGKFGLSTAPIKKKEDYIWKLRSGFEGYRLGRYYGWGRKFSPGDREPRGFVESETGVA